MAIQHRRGDYNDYMPSKMLPAELAVTLQNDPKAVDGKALHVAFAPGSEKTLMTFEDAEDMIADAVEIAISESVEYAAGEAKAWAHGNTFATNDLFSGDGTTKSFTLTYTPTSIISVHVGDAAITGYAVSEKVITFTNAPVTGTSNIRVEYTVDVTNDNAKYYKEQAASSATSASSSASTASTKASQASTSATNAQNAQQAIENMTASASSLPYGSTATVTKTSVGGVVNLAFGIPIGGKGDSGEVPVVEITQSAYDALPESEKTRSDILYVIPDGPSGALAEDVYYDPTESGIAETDVQSVLDDLVISLADLQNILGDYGTIQTSTTASRAYKVGERIILNGKLYKATADISQGDTLAVGTNISQTTVGEEDADKILWFSGETVSAQSSAGSIISISNSRITADHILACDHISYGNPSYVSGTPSWSTAAGSFTVTGVCSAQTTATFVLIKKDN